MQSTTQIKKPTRLGWWHHAAFIGALCIGAIYLVEHLYAGMLLFHAGPGDPLWLDDIIAWWHVLSGALLGVGIGVWMPNLLRPSNVRPDPTEKLADRLVSRSTS